MKRKKNVFGRWIYLIAFILFLSACSTKPTYYSKSDVDKYVHARFDSPKLIEEVSYKDDTKEKNMIYEYRYQDNQGIEFSVYCGTSHTRFNASTTIFYQKDISNNYIAAVYDLHEDEIMHILDELPFCVELNASRIQFHLENEEQISLAALAIIQLDELLNFHYYSDEMNYQVDINFYPVNASSDALDADSITAITFSNGQKERLRYEDVKTIIEQEVTDKSKQNNVDYGLSNALMQKYDAPILHLFIDGKEMEGYELTRRDGSYWMDRLDICQDFEDSPYDNKNIKHFFKLVEEVGGTYQCEDWKAKWVIDKDEWNAELKVIKEEGYRFIRVWKNGKEIEISNPKQINTVDGGTTFSLEDLSILLGKEYEIQQETMQVMIKK